MRNPYLMPDALAFAGDLPVDDNNPQFRRFNCPVEQLSAHIAFTEYKCRKFSVPCRDLHIVMTAKFEWLLLNSDAGRDPFHRSPSGRHAHQVLGLTYSLCEDIGTEFKITILLEDI